jgi:hypothetical protein
LRLNHFKIVEDIGLKLLHQGHLEWQHLPTKFHENPPIGSKVISGGGHTQTDRQAGDLISPQSIEQSQTFAVES